MSHHSSVRLQLPSPLWAVPHITFVQTRPLINYLVFNGICSNLSESKICIQSNKLTVHASIYPLAFVLPSFCLFVFLFICYVRLPPLGSVYPSVRPSVYLSIHHSLLNDLAFRLCDHLKYNPTNSTNFKAFLFTSATFWRLNIFF